MRSMVDPTSLKGAGRRLVLGLVVASTVSASFAVAPLRTPARAADGVADLSLHAESDRDVVPVGEAFTVTVAITNDGPDEATDVVVRAPLPGTWPFVKADPAADYDPDTGTWSVGELASGERKVLDIVATMNTQGLLFMYPEVAASAADDPDSTPGNCCHGEDREDDEAFVGVNGALEADMSLSMQVDDPTPGVGTNVTFELELTNAGPSHVSGVGVKDVLPSNLTFVSAMPSGEYDAGTGIWNAPPIAPDESASLEITAKVSDAVETTNYAEIHISSFIDHDSVRGNHSTGEDDDASVTVNPVDASADLTLHAGASPNNHPIIGGQAGVQFVVTNHGPDTARNVVVKDNLASLAEFAFDEAQTVESGTDYDFTTGTWTVGELASGATEVLEVHLTAVAAGEPLFMTEITRSSVRDPDSTPGNLETAGPEDDAAVFGFLVRGPSSDLSLTKTVDNPSPTVGEDVTFTLTMRNDGPYIVLGTSILDLLPPGLAFVSAAVPLNTEYNPTTGVWSGFGIDPGGSIGFEITATRTGLGPVTNRAEILTADLEDPDSTPGNGSTDEDDDASVTVTGVVLPLPSLSIDDVIVTEGDTGTTDAVFTVLLSAPSGSAVSVFWRTNDGSAVADGDYLATSGTAVIPAGDTKAAITVKVVGDLLEEPDETFTVTLVDPGAAVLSDDRVGTGTIVNDDGQPTISIDNTAVIEGNNGTTPATFTVSLSGPSSNPVSVDWKTVSGTANAGADYGSATGTVLFAPGDTTATIVIGILDDQLDEFNETFTVELFAPVNATIDDGVGVGTIRDDDAPPELSITDVMVTEGNAGSTLATFVVSMTAPSGKPVSVDFATSDVSATAGQDYAGATGTVSIAAGDTTGSLTVVVTGDTTFEQTETYRVDLSNAVNAGIAAGAGAATGFIVNDDPPPAISIGDVSVDEGNSGTRSATLHVTLSAASGLPVMVAWSTANGTALAGQDYATASGTVTFDPGDVDEPVAVLVSGDTQFEPDETFIVVLSGPVGGTIAGGTGVVTIRNDDADLSADVAVVKEADHNTSTNPIAPGARLVYTLTVTNGGPGTAADIQVSDVLPSPSTPDDARWCEAIAPDASCDTASGEPFDSATAIPSIEKLGPGETRRFQIGYTVSADAPSGPVQNTASIASSAADPNVANDSSTVTVLVDVLPVASFTFSPERPVRGDLIGFDAGGSSDDDGIAGYAWDFGDGTFGTGPTPTHHYPTADRYLVTLTVTDDVGGVASTDMFVDVSDPGGPDAHKMLRGTITRLVAFAPGGDPATGRVPVAGAEVLIGRNQNQVRATTDAQGDYVFTNLNCSPCNVDIRGPNIGQITPISVTLDPGSDSTTVRDFTVGNQPDQLYLAGLAVPPFTFPDEPPPADPATVAIRVYRTNAGPNAAPLADSATLGGPGSFGAYQLVIGRAEKGGLPAGSQLRVVLVENGVEVDQAIVVVPQAGNGLTQLVTVADLEGQ